MLQSEANARLASLGKRSYALGDSFSFALYLFAECEIKL